MSEWQKSVETRAKHTTAMYILEDGGHDDRARRKDIRRRGADMAFGLFSFMMGIAMCLLAAGMFIAAEDTVIGSPAFVSAYLVMGISLLIRGIAGIAR